MKNDTSLGDWIFLVGGIVLVGGWLGYENLATLQGWLLAIQTPPTAPPAPTIGLLAWVAGNWGLVLLMGAIIFAAFKMRTNSTGAMPVEGNNGIQYKRHRRVKVNLIR